VKKITFLSILFVMIMLPNACKQEKNTPDNPLLSQFNTPHGVPPFAEIQEEHYLPAFKKAMEWHQEEIQAIVNNQEAPTFENTLVALDESGEDLNRVSGVFYNLYSAHTSDTLQEIAKEISPKLSSHRDDIYLNKKLYERVESVYQAKEKWNLSPEDEKLLEETRKEFINNGANLPEEKKKALRELNEQLSVLSLEFGQNVLAETNDWKLVIDDQDDLAGLPETVIQGAEETAAELEVDGKWAFTLQKPSFIPFLQYAEKRELREKIFKAYINRGNNGNEHDNKEIAREIVNKRIEKARLLGHEHHASLVLEDRMARSSGEILDLLEKVWRPALDKAKEEAQLLQDKIYEEGNDFPLEPWDWWYYAEKVRQEKYALDDNLLRPYFALENVREGAFMVANKLFGLEITERTDLPIYHEDVKTFEVKESDGTHVGILYMDFFPRESKRGGAWMNSYRKQHVKNGEHISPVITNVLNFSKPTGDKPSLLTFEEVTTLFHEFGHGLHGLLSDCEHYSLSGTSVPRDFVELPSQIMENWAAEPEVLKMYAKHYQTGDVIPDEIIEKIEKSRYFNQGFATVEYLAASFLDMHWHTLQEKQEKVDVMAFEEKVLGDIGLIQEIVVRYRTPYFRHIFSSGYSAGYYSYIWAEVLDADAFQAFKENGLFDKATATAFRENILERGGTRDAMGMYKSFRGHEPEIKPLLQRKGLL
jgi:peptidyl-dipeptidase Dcp